MEIIEIRKRLVNFLNIVSPILVAILVHYKKINLLIFINGDFVKDISESGQVAINMAIITAIINIILSWLRRPCKIEINIENNRNKEITELPIANKQKYVKINMNLKINYQKLFLKKIIKKLGGVSIKILISDVMTYTISNKDEFAEAIEESKDYFILNMDKIIVDEEIKYTGNLEISLLSNVNTTQSREIRPQLYLHMDMHKIKKIFFYIAVFLFIDIESKVHTVEIVDWE